MNKETAKRQFSNAVEIMYEQGWMKFPKNLNTNKEFKITGFKNTDTITFEVREGKKKSQHVIFYAYDLVHSLYLRDSNDSNYAIRCYAKSICKDLYHYSNAQL